MTTKTVKFTRQRVDLSVEARIEDAAPMDCQWDARGRKFTPTRVVANFGHITTVRLSGPRIADSCSCDCHGRREDDEYTPDYSVTYYVDACDPDKHPPQWVADWLAQVNTTVAKSGVLR